MFAAQKKEKYIFTKTIKWWAMVNKNMKSICNRFAIDEKYGYYLLRDTEHGKRLKCDSIDEAQNQAEFII